MKTRGRNYRKYTLSPQEIAKRYGPPLVGREKVIAEMRSFNIDRMHRHTYYDEWIEEELEEERKVN